MFVPTWTNALSSESIPGEIISLAIELSSVPTLTITAVGSTIDNAKAIAKIILIPDNSLIDLPP